MNQDFINYGKGGIGAMGAAKLASTAKGKRFAFVQPSLVRNFSEDASNIDFTGIPGTRFK